MLLLELRATDSRDVLKVLNGGKNRRIVAVEHRTLGGSVSALMTDRERSELHDWLELPSPGPGRDDAVFLIPEPVRRNENGAPLYWHGTRHTAVQYEVHDLQTTMLVTKYNGTTDHALAVSIRWNGSGRTKGIRLTESQVLELIKVLEI